MERKNLALIWGRRIASREGWAGNILGAYLAPRSNHLAHVVAKRGMFGKPEVFSLEGATEGEDGMLLLAKGAPEAAGRGSVHLTPKTPVAIARVQGSLRGLVVDAKTRTPRHVLVRYQGDVRAVRYDLVHGLNDGSASVRVTAEEAAALPFHRGDAEALHNALAALEKADPMGDTYAAVVLTVAEGVAALTGNIPMPVQRDEMEQVVRSAKGVVEVENAVATDSELRLNIAAALAQAGVTRDGLVTVRCVRGNVTLLGRLRGQVAFVHALGIVKGVPGVRSVTSQIEVAQVGADLPAVAHTEAAAAVANV